MLNFNVPPAVRIERMKICESCKFFKQHTRSCGTLITAPLNGTVDNDYVPKENEVRHYKAKIKLCGCLMDQKTKYRFTKCPAGKWSQFQLSANEIDALRDFMRDITGRARLNTTDLQSLYNWKAKLTGRPEPYSTCASCVRELIDEFNKQLSVLATDETPVKP